MRGEDNEETTTQHTTLGSGDRGSAVKFGGEFDPGSGSTLAACLMHASRTGSPSGGSRGGRVRNTWAICPEVGDSHQKWWVRPHKFIGLRPDEENLFEGALGGACGGLASWWGNGLPRR
jgi:hypothetical protein